jgi:hypothetical protein
VSDSSSAQFAEAVILRRLTELVMIEENTATLSQEEKSFLLR